MAPGDYRGRSLLFELAIAFLLETRAKEGECTLSYHPQDGSDGARNRTRRVFSPSSSSTQGVTTKSKNDRKQRGTSFETCPGSGGGRRGV